MKKIEKSLVCVSLLLLVVFFSGCSVQLEVLSEQMKETVIQTNGEDDYALKYLVRVRNKGRFGKIRAIAEVFTSEGKFYREKIVSLDKDEDVELEFIFTEITVLGEFVRGLKGDTEIKYKFRYETIR